MKGTVGGWLKLNWGLYTAGELRAYLPASIVRGPGDQKNFGLSAIDGEGDVELSTIRWMLRGACRI